MEVRTLTFGEMFTAMRMGDVRMMIGFAVECAIMSSPIAILVGAWVAPR